MEDLTNNECAAMYERARNFTFDHVFTEHGYQSCAQCMADFCLAETESLRQQLSEAEEKLHKQDGMANEINILVKENRTLAADLKAAKDKIERLERVTLRDWPEDLADEDNGDYLHKCDTCTDDFFGHKRRAAICKKCWIEYATKIVVEHNQQKAVDDVRGEEVEG